MDAPLITIFVRHSAGLQVSPGMNLASGANCKKHLRWSQNGKQHRLKTGSRSWAGAEEKKRELEAQLTGQHTPAQNTAPRTLADAIEIFMADKKSQGVTADVLGRYARELARLRDFAEHRGIFTAAGLSRELLIEYKADWEDLYPSGNTQASVQARLKNFLSFCFDSQWMVRIPKLSRVKVDEVPTLPLTDEEYERLLETVPVSFTNPKKTVRVRALVRLMRHSGLAIVDAATLRHDDLIHDKGRGFYRIVTARQKTGTDVSVVIPPDVAQELLTVLNGNPTYVFWTGIGDPRTAVSHWQADFRTLFSDAKIRAGGA